MFISSFAKESIVGGHPSWSRDQFCRVQGISMTGEKYHLKKVNLGDYGRKPLVKGYRKVEATR